MINAYAAFEAKGPLKPFQYDPGALGDFDVEIDVDHCGICHSDVSMLDNDWGRAKYPMVAGHEVIGRVVAVGPGKVAENGERIKPEVKKGDRVLYGKYSGTEVTVEGEELLILRESDILATV